MATKSVSKRAIEAVIEYERKNLREPKNVSRDGVGYDLHSGDRCIEVKGVSESWKTYTWQSIYPSEVDAMKSNPTLYWLYIVKFEDKEDESAYEIYTIPATEFVSDEKFRLRIASFSLTPISRKKLEEYRQAR
jgi:hypothetical protein